MLPLRILGNLRPIEVAVISAELDHCRVAGQPLGNIPLHHLKPLRRGIAKLCTVDNLNAEAFGSHIHRSRFGIAESLSRIVIDDALRERVSPNHNRFPCRLFHDRFLLF
ncbi:hypothetical protein SDC9_142946 [bioreactor metagenome]|uniref:Uncharacterized protein n=1 Tax=bioreactor metagenome TaxID=1076179 RepID=A0A645E2L4_9ZZZZ